MPKFRHLLPVICCLGAAPAAQADEFSDAARAFFDSEIAGWLSESALIDAIEAQNAAHSGLDQAAIDTLDQTWRAEVGTAEAPLVDAVMAHPMSEWLRTQRDGFGGIVTEVFVMDNHGLNVAASDVTSDYWQGDEAKFSETFGQGAGAVHIADVEFDESTQTYQVQVSAAISDAAGGAPIGAITVGVNVELLP